MLEFWIIQITALLTAITVHEFSHALAAEKLGDPTPRLQGRLTLNPLVHLDKFGTLVLILTGFRFGWGKPVMFDPYNLKNPRRDAAIISFAGPFSNLVVASTLSLILKFIIPEANFLQPFIILNVGLAVFNLVPVHPLDGGKILVGLLPSAEAREIDRFLHQYGTFILLILIIPVFGSAPLVSVITTPIIRFFLSVLLPSTLFI